SIATRDYVAKRDESRQGVCKILNGARICLADVQPGRAGIIDNDRAEALVDNGTRLVKSLADMDKLKTAKVDRAPWSDDYWGLYKGSVAARYADPQFPAAESWKDNKAYFDANTLQQIFTSANASSIDNLSPAEKYDLLVGDN